MIAFPPESNTITMQSTTECARPDCHAQATPLGLGTHPENDESRIVWSCEDGHIFTTDVHGENKQN